MNRHSLALAGGAACAALCLEWSPALARDADGLAQSAELVAQVQDFEDGYGELNTVTLDYKFETDETTLVLTPQAGERKGGGSSRSALGIGADLYQALSASVTSRTAIAVAEDEPAFPHYDLAQDVTFKAAPQTTGTIGVRWARYFGGRDVYFASAGARYYFRRGSVAYRLSYIDPEGRDGFLAHLVSLSIDDAQGGGKTQFWLGTGASSADRIPLDQDFSGDDYGAFLRRVQPIGDRLSLIAGAGIDSYDRPGNRITAWKFALGLRYELNQ